MSFTERESTDRRKREHGNNGWTDKRRQEDQNGDVVCFQEMIYLKESELQFDVILISFCHIWEVLVHWHRRQLYHQILKKNQIEILYLRSKSISSSEHFNREILHPSISSNISCSSFFLPLEITSGKQAAFLRNLLNARSRRRIVSWRITNHDKCELTRETDSSRARKQKKRKLQPRLLFPPSASLSAFRSDFHSLFLLSFDKHRHTLRLKGTQKNSLIIFPLSTSSHRFLLSALLLFERVPRKTSLC